MKSALSFLLLVWDYLLFQNDRSSMLNRFKIVSDDYKAGNVTLIKSIVEKFGKEIKMVNCVSIG